ncbi:MAG: CoB--CoM heterodisulfide reductase iron-sulfur subunit B family protein [Syntrophobacteraceae bacterium]
MKEALAYYPGCSGLGTSKEYDTSTRSVCSALGLRLVDVPDWSCCGSSPAHTLDHCFSAALAARNLELVSRMDLQQVATPCPSCLTNLKTATHRMADESFRSRVNRLLDNPCKGSVESISVLQAVFEQVGPEAIKKRVVRSLEGLRVAPYYGCIMNRPPEVMEFDDPENPTAMDEILAALGAEVVPFPLKVECCGGSFGVPRREIVTRLAGKLLACARDNGADMVAVACPMCQMNLDLRQGQVNRACGETFHMPVVYFTQLMGFAMGLKDKDLGLGKLNINPRPILERVLAAQAEKAQAKPVDGA